MAGSAVEGGVVAYQVGWVIFLGPYAVLAQPIHTAILPEMVTEAREHGLDRVGRSLRWALERMALLVVPVTAGMVALAVPAMRLVPFGETGDQGGELLAAAVAGLAVGPAALRGFLLLARGYYALGDSRTPGSCRWARRRAGVAVMAVGALTLDGAARIAVLGLAHSLAYTVGVAVLGVGLARRTGSSLWPAALGRVVAVSVVVGRAAWAVSGALLGDDPGPAGRPRRGGRRRLVGAALVLGGLPGARGPLGADHPPERAPGPSRWRRAWCEPAAAVRSPGWWLLALATPWPWPGAARRRPAGRRRRSTGCWSSRCPAWTGTTPRPPTCRTSTSSRGAPRWPTWPPASGGAPPPPPTPTSRWGPAPGRSRRLVDTAVAVDPDETYGGVPASELLERRLGEVPAGIAYLAIGPAIDANEHSPFGAEVGSLGDRLAGAGSTGRWWPTPTPWRAS